MHLQNARVQILYHGLELQYELYDAFFKLPRHVKA